MTVKIKYFNKNIDKVAKLAVGDWIDLRCAEPDGVKLKAGDSFIIHLGVGMILPDNYEAHLAPRSSTFKKYGILLTNSLGIIDNSYSGEEDEWMANFYATRDTVIPFNERICQFRIIERQPSFEILEVDHLNKTSRGGFGSTDNR